MPDTPSRRSLIYSRPKGSKGDKAFGAELNVNQPGYECFVQSIAPKAAPEAEHRVRSGGPGCTQPYDASLLHFSSVSFGSLPKNAVFAKNDGAAQPRAMSNGKPGTLPGAQHTVQDAGTREDHVAPGDEDGVSPDVD